MRPTAHAVPNVAIVVQMLPRHFFLPTTIYHTTTTHHTTHHAQSMPPRTRTDDKASRSAHIQAHTPIHKRGPSNAGDQASKRQKKHQDDPDDTAAQPEAMQEVKKGTKTGKARKGKKPRYAPTSIRPPSISLMAPNNRKTSMDKAAEDASQAPPKKLTP